MNKLESRVVVVHKWLALAYEAAKASLNPHYSTGDGKYLKKKRICAHLKKS